MTTGRGVSIEMLFEGVQTKEVAELTASGRLFHKRAAATVRHQMLRDIQHRM